MVVTYNGTEFIRYLCASLCKVDLSIKFLKLQDQISVI